MALFSDRYGDSRANKEVDEQVPRTGTTRGPRVSRRTRIVWGSFLASMTMVTAMLALSDHGAVPGFLATNTSVVTRGSNTDYTKWLCGSFNFGQTEEQTRCALCEHNIVNYQWHLLVECAHTRSLCHKFIASIGIVAPELLQGFMQTGLRRKHLWI